MGRGSILSCGLFVLPIGITAGVLVGLDAFRSSQGQPRLFRNNKINVDVYCQRAYGIHPTTDGQDYTRKLTFSGLPEQAIQPLALTEYRSIRRCLVPDLTCWGLARLFVPSPTNPSSFILHPFSWPRLLTPR
jgi:hypothetical protein